MSALTQENRVAALTQEIATHAQSKQLEEAKALFNTILREGLKPSSYTYSALINAHVNSGDLVGATRTLEEMVHGGFKANVIVLTTLLKGHCAIGDLAAARQLIEGMVGASPPIRPDARTLNTFLRGCVRVGDLGAARWAFGSLESWRVSPGPAASVAYGRLLSQGLMLGELRKQFKAYAASADAPVAHKPSATANPCLFWQQGRCERGLNCRFAHDTAIKQIDAPQVEAAHRDTELELSVHLAHAAALLGRRSACKHALARADTLQAAAAAAGSADGGGEWGSGGRGGGGGRWGEQQEEQSYGTGLHAGFRRAELGRDAARIAAYVNGLPKCKKAKGGGATAARPMTLNRYLGRCLIFSTRIGETEAAAADREGGATRERKAGHEVAEMLVDALRHTAGLSQADRLGLAAKRTIAKRLGKAVSRKGRLHWRRIFREAAPAADDAALTSEACLGGGAGSGGGLPVKLEIASGTGDWVVAQARADVGRASWACIEWRHDRVYSTLSRMCLQAVPNLCVMGGDAAAIVRHHLKPRSVAHAFVNFPEPPSGHEGYEASNALHLLTPKFFTDLHRVLRPGGHLTIFSDNGRYCRALAATLGALRSDDGAPLLVSQRLNGTPGSTGDAPRFEEVNGVRLYYGVPGRECGHLQSEMSYFDRLWEYRQGDETQRFYMHLQARPCPDA